MSQAKQLQRILEGAIMAAGEPLSTNRMTDLFADESAVPAKSDFLKALKALQKKYTDSGFELVEVASGWRFQVKEDLAQWVNRLWDEKPQKYSRALLETLALIAYRQPLTRGDIEEVRGVAVSSHIIKTLVERDWVRVVGHRDVPGRPALFATTRDFLDYFNLKSLEELPALGELQDMQSLNADLDFGAPAPKDTSDSDSDSGSEPEASSGELASIKPEQTAEPEPTRADAEVLKAENTDTENTDTKATLTHSTHSTDHSNQEPIEEQVAVQADQNAHQNTSEHDKTVADESRIHQHTTHQAIAQSDDTNHSVEKSLDVRIQDLDAELNEGFNTSANVDQDEPHLDESGESGESGELGELGDLNQLDASYSDQLTDDANSIISQPIPKVEPEVEPETNKIKDDKSMFD